MASITHLHFLCMQLLLLVSTPPFCAPSIVNEASPLPSLPSSASSSDTTEGKGQPFKITPGRKFSLRALPKMATPQEILDDVQAEGLNATNEEEGSMIQAMNFMRKFGYVPAGDDTADYIFSAETLTEKLKIVQKFGAIPQTGELDEATVKLMVSPRCGVHDVDSEEGKRRRKRFILGSSGWSKRDITYNVANWSPKLISKENAQVELRRAFDHWSKYSRLRFIEIGSNDADIVIFFAEYSHNDYYPFDGMGGVLAHAYYPYEFGAYGGDIHFDESEDWKFRATTDEEGLDFFTVAVHEIGHALGLAHSPVQSSIMFPYYKGPETNFELDYDDVMGMWDLYIKRRLDGDEEYFKKLASESTTTTTTTTTTTPSYDATQNDGSDDDVRYHGDYETVFEHEERNKGHDKDLPSLPPLFPDYEDETEYEREKRRREDEQRRREQEEEKRRREREEEEKRRRKEEEERRRKEEEDRIKRWEEKIRREEEESRRREEQEEKERRKWREETERRKQEWETKQRTTTVATPTDDVIPDICRGDFDSVALIRDEVFIFKGQHMWRFETRGRLAEGYPAPIRSLFPGLPLWLQKIDAVYERRNDSRIVFFTGKYFYVHDGNRLVEGSPRPITDYGLPESITQIDAVFYWPKNQKTYLFSRNLYWRRSDALDLMEAKYPRGIDRWYGVPTDLDAAVTNKQGVSYFFKDGRVWEYDNVNIRPTLNSPYNDLRPWTGCS